MKHPFSPNEVNRSLCNVCNRNYIDHTPAAECESCGSFTSCELNSHKKLLCAKCYDSALDVIIIQADTRKPEIPVEPKELTPEEIIEHSQEVDNSIRYNGDIYNAKTIAIVELRAAINKLEISENERAQRFQEELADRYYKLSNKIFELDNEKFELVTERLAISNTLREFGNNLRTEAREKLRESDNLYQPIQQKIVKPKIKRKEDPFLKMVKAFADLHGISESDAMDRLKNGKL